VAFFESFDNKEVAQTVCAFLNTKGGRIIVGAKQGGQVNIFQHFSDLLSKLRKEIYHSITPDSLVGIREEKIEDHPFVLIEVIEGNRKPYSINNRAYVRKDDRTLAASNNDMSEIVRSVRQNQYSWERLAVMEASIEMLDIELVQKTILNSNRLERSSRFETTEYIRFLDHNHLVGQRVVNNSAIVLYGKDPTYFIPQCRVRLIEFAESKVSDNYKDTLVINDNLFVTYQTLKNYFKRNTPVISEFKDGEWERSDREKFPLKALD
jgi:ATP-dependent DNA helicase RecG